MRRLLIPLLGVATVLALIAGPVVYAFHEEKQMRNFRVVCEGKLYRSTDLHYKEEGAAADDLWQPEFMHRDDPGAPRP